MLFVAWTARQRREAGLVPKIIDPISNIPILIMVCHAYSHDINMDVTIGSCTLNGTKKEITKFLRTKALDDCTILLHLLENIDMPRLIPKLTTVFTKTRDLEEARITPT